MFLFFISNFRYFGVAGDSGEDDDYKIDDDDDADDDSDDHRS